MPCITATVGSSFNHGTGSGKRWVKCQHRVTRQPENLQSLESNDREYSISWGSPCHAAEHATAPLVHWPFFLRFLCQFHRASNGSTDRPRLHARLIPRSHKRTNDDWGHGLPVGRTSVVDTDFQTGVQIPLHDFRASSRARGRKEPTERSGGIVIKTVQKRTEKESRKIIEFTKRSSKGDKNLCWTEIGYAARNRDRWPSNAWHKVPCEIQESFFFVSSISLNFALPFWRLHIPNQ